MSVAVYVRNGLWRDSQHFLRIGDVQLDVLLPKEGEFARAKAQDIGVLGKITQHQEFFVPVVIEIVDAEKAIAASLGKAAAVLDLSRARVEEQQLLERQHGNLRTAIAVEILDHGHRLEEEVDGRCLPRLHPLAGPARVTTSDALLPLALHRRLAEPAFEHDLLWARVIRQDVGKRGSDWIVVLVFTDTGLGMNLEAFSELTERGIRWRLFPTGQLGCSCRSLSRASRLKFW
jgi:hypothetical protein